MKITHASIQVKQREEQNKRKRAEMLLLHLLCAPPLQMTDRTCCQRLPHCGAAALLHHLSKISHLAIHHLDHSSSLLLLYHQSTQRTHPWHRRGGRKKKPTSWSYWTTSNHFALCAARGNDRRAISMNHWSLTHISTCHFDSLLRWLRRIVALIWKLTTFCGERKTCFVIYITFACV